MHTYKHEMFGILFRCRAFLVLDAAKGMDKEVKSSTAEPEQSGMNSKSTGLIQMQHKQCDVTTFLFLCNRF